MKYGFIKVATATFDIKVADCMANAKEIVSNIKEASKNATSLIAFPELCISGYTCSDLFLQSFLLEDSKEALRYILNSTKDLDITCIVGMPFEVEAKLYNCAICFYKGNVLGIVPKSYIPNYNEFYEKRHFNVLEDGQDIYVEDSTLSNEKIHFGKIIFDTKIKNFKFAIEICEDLWTVIPPSSYYSLNGASLVVNISASNEIAGKEEYRKELVKNQSARCMCGYMYVSAGNGESTTDLVFSGHNMIYENGKLLNESEKFKSNITYAEVDLEYIINERRRNTSFTLRQDSYIKRIEYNLKDLDFDLTREIDKAPFVPKDEEKRAKRCKEILDIQAYGLKKRIEHIGIKNVVIGISGGLDSTQALLVINRAYDILGYDKKGIIAVTMPCFGTSDRTYNNAKKLCNLLGTTLLDIDIKEAVLTHFKDIGQDENIKDTTYENSQARERTKVLMDLANKYNGIVIGTGDLSELALGFATYNGDHMSMYGVNASIPKTLIRYLVGYFASISDNKLRQTLMDILETPVSPELLPPDEKGELAQITEDIVGPYELHDFFLYNMIRYNFDIEKIYYLAKKAFNNSYENSIILKWLEKFYIRFFTQQFKRSCLPDGPKVGSVSLSPRGDFRMPSDASFRAILNKIEKMKEGEE